ncbi:hypothetical protein HZA38_06670 [Candidatus Peregrinibacteria bacterium]|nr:hypothetical protein [Candidatus Peregrinibacteria bacterium]
MSIVNDLIQQIDRVLKEYKSVSEDIKRELKTASEEELKQITVKIDEIDKFYTSKIKKLADEAYGKLVFVKKENDESQIEKIKQKLHNQNGQPK